MSEKVTEQGTKEIGIESRLVDRANRIRKVAKDDLPTQDIGGMSFVFSCVNDHIKEEGIQIHRPEFDNSEYRCTECGDNTALQLE